VLLNNSSTGTNGRSIKDEMLLQLHNQYAINNNANLSSAVALIAAMIAVVGFYAYVFAHATLGFSDTFGELYCVRENSYYLDALVLMTIATVAVLCIQQAICIYQGCAQRNEQFIVFAIRKKYGMYGKGTIFPEGYCPFNKKHNKKCCLLNVFRLKKGTGDIPQGLFGEILAILSIVQYAVIALTFAKLCCCKGTCWWVVAIVAILCVIISLAVCSAVACYAGKQIEKYEEREEEYKKYCRKFELLSYRIKKHTI